MATAQQLEVLAELKCDYVQGYHLSRPLTATAFSSFAAEVLPPLLPDPRKGLYDMKRGLRPRIRAVGASCQVMPQCSSSRSR